jgi:hypothetical protein
MRICISIGLGLELLSAVGCSVTSVSLVGLLFSAVELEVEPTGVKIIDRRSFPLHDFGSDI